MADTALAALEKSGSPRDIDACLTSPVGAPHYNNLLMSIAFHEYLGLGSHFETCMSTGGGSSVAMLEVASSLVLSGKADRVLCVAGAGTPRPLHRHRTQR